MYDFKKIEEEARKSFTEKDEKRTVSDDKARKKLFSFLEGPPTANAPPALHHLEVRTYKDIINRFRYMQGFNVPRKAGWDCHGLPVEVQIEKKLKLNSKKDILKFGEAKFIKECKDSVFSYIKAWNDSTKRLGYLADLEKPYVTLENDYIESVWWSLKQLYDKKLLYEAHKVVPYCPRCETPLSSHEVALGYRDIKEESVYIAFKVRGKDDEYILAWTTTPWTLPGNVALAVGEKIKYVKVKLSDGDKLILGKDRINVLKGEYEILEEFSGKELLGIKYEPLYDIRETQNENSHQIIPADFVTTEDGTGIVHTAVMYGEDDYNVGMKLKLPAVHTVGEDGKFLDIVPYWKGMFVKDAEENIKEELRGRHLLYKTEKVLHAYPFCWRCETPLLYYAIKSWFVEVTKYKERLIELNNKINWVPKHIKDGRFGKWLESVKDWALSRKKFWGTPLPIWRCECGEEKAIGSIKEMKKYCSKKISEKEIDLHKPWIDKIRLKCKCGKEMNRVEDVIDCWYDSGSASFAQFHYPFENKKEFEKRFPYDFIAEAIDQTRGWFYTLHVLSTLLFDKVAFKNVICAGHIVDENGNKMSKSKGNILNPDEVLDTVGVDATRLQFCMADIGSQKRFGINLVKEETIPFLNTLWNTFQYYKQLENEKKPEIRIEDKWILSRLNSTIEQATKSLENYYIENALEPIISFVVGDFSRTYIKIVRDREDQNVKKIIGEILEKVSKILAPYAPNITEIIYKEFGKKSVHLSEWPKVENKKILPVLEKEFKKTLEIIEAGLALRDKEKIGLKWPLAKADIKCDLKLKTELKEIILIQLNVKKINISDGKSISVELDTRQTSELEAEGYARELSRQIQSFRKELGLEKKEKVETYIITDDEFKKIIENQKDFIKDRTNSKKLEIVTTDKERFKKNNEFKIKDKRGKIAIIHK